MASLVEMDPDLARRLLVEAGTLIITGVPEGTQFGIDKKSWYTEEKFLGIKMIPPGIHYVHYSAVNKHGDTAPRVGFIHNFKKREMVLKRWDTIKEELHVAEVSEEEFNRFTDNLQNIDRFLGAYPYEQWDEWKDLTNKINVNTYDKFLPLCGQIRSALELIGSSHEGRKNSKTDTTDLGSSSTPPKRQRKSGPFTEQVCDSILLPELKPVAGTELRLSSIPQNNYPEGCSPSDITKFSLDSSYVLEQLMAKYESTSDILSELQFTFICFLVGHSLEAFEQWKNLVGILCSADEALPKYTSIYIGFLSVLNVQLKEIPEDFLVDIVASNNFIYKSLKTLFRTIEENKDNVDHRLRSKALRFKETLTQTFGWDYSNVVEEDEDELPVVVEL